MDKNTNIFVQRDFAKTLEKDFKIKLKERDIELERVSTVLKNNLEKNKEIQKLYEETKRNLEALEKENRSFVSTKQQEVREQNKGDLKQLKILEKELNKLNKDLKNKDNETEQLKFQTSNLKSELKQSEKIISELKVKNKKERKKSEDPKDKGDYLNKIEKQELIISDLERDIKAEGERKEEQTKKIDELEAKLSNLERELKNNTNVSRVGEKSAKIGNIEDLKTAFKVCNERYDLLGLTSNDSVDKGNAIELVKESIKSSKSKIDEFLPNNKDDQYLLTFYTDDLEKKKDIIKKLSKKAEKQESSEKEDKILLFNKKVSHGGHHGGAWKVAYADFVTAMMAFFLLMWLLSQLSQNSKDNLVEYFKNYKVFEHTGKAIPKFRQETYKRDEKPIYVEEYQEVSQSEKDKLKKAEFIKEFKQRYKGSEEHVSVELLSGGIRIQIMDLYDKPMFETGKEEPTPEALEIFEFVSERLKTLPGSLIIEGHTDGMRYRGSKYTNWELSMGRASAARVELTKNGILPHRIKRIVAYGPSEPIIKDDHLNPRNRRINIIVLNEKAN